jgi:hypothetical protein
LSLIARDPAISLAILKEPPSRVIVVCRTLLALGAAIPHGSDQSRAGAGSLVDLRAVMDDDAPRRMPSAMTNVTDRGIGQNSQTLCGVLSISMLYTLLALSVTKSLF